MESSDFVCVHVYTLLYRCTLRFTLRNQRQSTKKCEKADERWKKTCWINNLVSYSVSILLYALAMQTTWYTTNKHIHALLLHVFLQCFFFVYYTEQRKKRKIRWTLLNTVHPICIQTATCWKLAKHTAR